MSLFAAVLGLLLMFVLSLMALFLLPPVRAFCCLKDKLQGRPRSVNWHDIEM